MLPRAGSPGSPARRAAGPGRAPAPAPRAPPRAAQAERPPARRAPTTPPPAPGDRPRGPSLGCRPAPTRTLDFTKTMTVTGRSSGMHSLGRLSLGLLAALAAGCGAASTRVDRPPSVAVNAWAEAVSKDDPRAAYGLLADAVKKDMPYELFAQRWKDSRAERDRQTVALRAALREDPRLGERGKLTL